MVTTERIERVLAASYSADLGSHDLDQLRAMKQECSAIETAVSYLRRLAQARAEILEAEQRRRAEGGSISDLIDQLPTILAGGAARSGAGDTRHAEPDEDILELRWPDGRERRLDDDSLANLPSISDTEVVTTLAGLRDFERELSEYRRSLHSVIGAVEHEIAVRAAAGR